MSKQFMIIAHRGASGYEFENSISAFKKAIQLKADFIETDVRKTKDNFLILIHDENLFSSTDRKKNVSKLNYQELKTIKLKNGELIPTVEDLLELHDGKIGFNFELKIMKIEDSLIQIVKKYDLLDFVVFSTRSMKVLKQIKKIEPTAQLQLIVFFPHVINQKGNPFKKFKEIGISALNPIYPLMSNIFVKKAHEAGLKIFPWTVNDKEKILELQKRGVDGVITNYPDILTGVSSEFLDPKYINSPLFLKRNFKLH